ncbi:MAG: bifunctional demethylmenaquinone methyltransferase/2-methoxy-6-polyprenyl-1,4-benzoquinol methylase UbiE [Pseudomonadota bacterium]
MAETKDESVSFGFEDVTAEQKVERVKGVFRSVASRYDLMNDLMSAGVHRLWKADTMARLNPQPGEHLIDVAGGTGDLAKAFLQRADKVAKRKGTSDPASATICDINDAMLAAGRRRKDMAEFSDRLQWVCGDAEALPFPDASADALTIAFGIRNVAGRMNALKEFRRVLKPGGRLAILEFSHMTAPLFQRAYDAYSFSVIPPMGGVITGDRDSYQYLIESIRRFPKQDAFTAEIDEAGFSHVAVTNFSGGIAALHTGRVI